MKVSATYRNIWTISYPIILGSLATTILNLTDTAFIARVGEIELGAMALATVFYFVIVMIGLALATGAQILIARRAGEGNHPEIGRLFDHTFLILAAMALVATLATILYSDLFFRQILRSEAITKACNEYMGTRAFGFLFAMTTFAFRALYIGIGQTRVITYTAVIMMVINIILDYLLIFGHYGFPEMGMAGAALASVISEMTALLYLVVFSGVKHEFREFRLFKLEQVTLARMRSIWHLASPVILQNTLSMGAWFLFFVFIERMGEHELAISNIIRATYMVIMTPIWGYASATNSMVSNLIGQEKQGEVKILVKKIINLSLLTTAVVFAISFLSPQWVLRITTSDLSLIDDSMGCYYIIIGAMFLFSVSVILLSAVSGSGNTRAAMIIEFINIAVYMIYVYLCAVVWHASIEAVWFSEIMYWILMGVLSFLYLNKRKWQHKQI